MEDLVEDIEESLDTFTSVGRDLPLTSLWLSGAIPEKMSIPVILLKGTVGKLRRLLEDVFDVVEEDENELVYGGGEVLV